jgi:hypothetical protein
MRLGKSEPIFEDLLYVPPTVKDRNYLQRSCGGPVNDQVRVDGEEFHFFVR